MSDAQVTLAAGLVGVFALVVLAAAISSLITGRLALPGAARLGVSRTSAPVAFRLCLTLMLLTAAHGGPSLSCSSFCFRLIEG